MTCSLPPTASTETVRLLRICASLPTWWDVRIGPELNDVGERFLTACVYDRHEKSLRKYEGLLFGVSVEDGDYEGLSRLLADAIERRLVEEGIDLVPR